MAAVFVIHAPEDIGFVVDTLLKPLPSLGFDCWLSSSMDGAKAAIVVVSKAARKSEAVKALAASLLNEKRTTLLVRLDGTDPDDLAQGLVAFPSIDLAESAEGVSTIDAKIRDGLPQLLPSIETAADVEDAGGAVVIEWDTKVFSQYLREAIARHDFDRGASLIDSLTRHVRRRRAPYPVEDAQDDLAVLRANREFKLMESYAGAVIASGTDDAKVRRQFAQALIELRKFPAAEPILRGNAETTKPGEREWFEAHGLLGRLYKQQYVDAPNDAKAPGRLRRAVEEYLKVCNEYPNEFWHGVNAASLILRAKRDGFDWAKAGTAETIADGIIEQIDGARAVKAAKDLPVFDLASRVEALIAREQFDVAEQALDEYLTHPKINAFEVASTFRQFHEVLQLDQVERGHAIYDALKRAADRFRAGGAISSLQQSESASASNILPILIRVSDPSWEPGAELAGEITIGARVGSILTARATRAAIALLLKEPAVISIEESLTVANALSSECDVCVPFIKVDAAGKYRSASDGKEFEERGKHALIAIIDDGIDVLHRAFLDAEGQTRIVGIWDQRDESGRKPRFGYGTYHTAEDVQRYVKDRDVPQALGRNVKGHGTLVASIAAGRPAGAFFGGVAQDARLLIIKAEVNGQFGYASSHVDALAFIADIAAERKCPVVVNISKGMNAGAHDGKALLELAVNAFAGGGGTPGRVVVKSAGNESNKRGHAEIHVAAGGSAQVQWLRKRQLFGFERIEFWWNSHNRYQFRLQSPGGDQSRWVSTADPDVSGFLEGGGFFQMQLTPFHPDNGDSQLRIEIGDSSSRERTGVTPGQWTLEIIAEEAFLGGPIHGWIARAGGRREDFSEFLNCLSEAMTITVPGTADTVITVGAVGAKWPALVGAFSSKGPTRDGRHKPDVAAPGVTVVAAQGGTCDGAIKGCGTSMAAPHVTGAIALALSRAVETKRPWPTASQIGKELQRKTQKFNGQYDPGQGFGVIDVAAFLASRL